MTPPTIDPRAPTLDLLTRFGPESDGPSPSFDESLAYVRGLATTHYENFSVLSSLVPARLRDDFAAVYAFCRWADDIGDEIGSTREARERATALLAWWRRNLRECFAYAANAGVSPAPRHPVYIALARTVASHQTPIQPFLDLIDAFEQDQRVTRYDTWDQLLDYCRRSANPVGRIVLHLGGYPDTPTNADRFRMSDATCTALQLINFWQDVRRDLIERGRVYLPQAETGLSAETLRSWLDSADDPAARVPFIKAMRPLLQRTAALFREGAPLPSTLSRDIRPVVWLFGAGGRSLQAAVEQIAGATLWERPTLSKPQKALLVGRAWLMFRLFGGAARSARSGGSR